MTWTWENMKKGMGSEKEKTRSVVSGSGENSVFNRGARSVGAGWNFVQRFGQPVVATRMKWEESRCSIGRAGFERNKKRWQ